MGLGLLQHCVMLLNMLVVICIDDSACWLPLDSGILADSAAASDAAYVV